jgi:hypothetical protein
LALLSASQAIVKGLFEADQAIGLVAGSFRDPFGGLARAALNPDLTDQFRRHDMKLRRTPDAGRAVHLALATVRISGGALVCIANDEIDAAMPHLRTLMESELEGAAPLVIVLEDRPRGGCSSPRKALLQLGLPAIEPANVTQLRDAIEHASTLSLAGATPVGIVAHVSILRTSDTIRIGPNRVADSVDGQLARRQRQRRPRGSEVGGILRMARRLELNRGRSMPSPGERESWGFITVGPAEEALRHVIYELELIGRVPHLRLGVLNPIDDAAVGRILTRCDAVIVLEPRPGEMELVILQVAERLRRQGERPAAIWGRTMPPGADGAERIIKPDDNLHPSVLARNIERPLHSIRPTLGLASLLAPEPPAPAVMPVPRGARIGGVAAVAALRDMVRDVQQQLAEQAAESTVEATTLALDGVRPPIATGRIIDVEVLDRAHFERDGRGVMAMASRDDRSGMLIIYAGDPEGARDVERLAQGMVPGDRAERVRITGANLAERAELLRQLSEAAVEDLVTVVVVGDGPPARFDPVAADRAVAQIDRLGFRPAQTLIGPGDQACEFAETESGGQPPRVQTGASPLHSRFTVSESGARLGGRVRIRSLLEQVAVIRTRAPAREWQRMSNVRLPVPKPIHGRQSVWRVHLSGVRGPAPGVVTRVLCEAGRYMDFAVRTLHNATPTGAGNRAWAQVMLTHPGADDDPPPLTPWIPYAEADLLLCIDGDEAIRAVAPDQLRVADADRTGAVVNTGLFEEEGGGGDRPIHGADLIAAMRPVTRVENRMFEDFAGACRAWFHTDRLTDLAVLGSAFQMGLVPLSVEAIELAVERIEGHGFGRSLDAFQFGRQLAADGELLTRPKAQDEEEIDRTIRRMALFIRKRSTRWSDTAQQFEWLATRSVGEMPGLSETDPGRQALRDFVTALYRCTLWGGIECASRFEKLITELYHVDRGDKGRAVTRNVILPLAEAFLIRDPLYVATMATNSEHRRRIRSLLNVKPARQDRIETRYLTRIEFGLMRRRVRMDLRTSDWLARIVARSARFIPTSWRGSTRERGLRAHLEEFVEHATESKLADYERWFENSRRLYQYAQEGRLRGKSAVELRLVISERTSVRNGESDSSDAPVVSEGPREDR